MDILSTIHSGRLSWFFMESHLNRAKPLRLDAIIVPEEYLETHQHLLDLRDKMFAHADLDLLEELILWTRAFEFGRCDYYRRKSEDGKWVHLSKSKKHRQISLTGRGLDRKDELSRRKTLESMGRDSETRRTLRVQCWGKV